MSTLSVQLRLEPSWAGIACLCAAVYLLLSEVGRRRKLRQVDDVALEGKYLPSHRLVRYVLWVLGAGLLLWDPSVVENPLSIVGGLRRWYGNGTAGGQELVGQVEWDWDYLDWIGVERESTASRSSVSMPRTILTNLLVFLLCGALALAYKFAILVVKVLRYVSVCYLWPAERPASKGPPRRVLIVHGSIGAGHKRAAQAIAEGLAERHPEIEVTTVDIVDFAGSVFNALYKTGYLALAELQAGSHVVGYLFDNSNKVGLHRVHL